MDTLFLTGSAALSLYLFTKFGRLSVSETPPPPLDERARLTVETLTHHDDLILENALKIRLLSSAFLGLVLLFSTVGIVVLSFADREIPPALSGLAGTAIGALVPSLTAAKAKS